MIANPIKISLVVADDHPVVLEGIAAILDADDNLKVCARCLSGADALRAIDTHRPDIAVLDIVMPDMTGLDVIARMTAGGLQTKVIFLTANASDGHILAAIERGARGLLLKDAAINELVQCIRVVADGGHHFPRDLVAAAVERETGRRSAAERFERDLTPREREILLLVAEGLSNQVIAHRLTLAEGTVRIHMHHIYQKTGSGSRAALIGMAIAHRNTLTT